MIDCSELEALAKTEAEEDVYLSSNKIEWGCGRLNVLFVCTSNIHRSKTAERVFSLADTRGDAFCSAGVSRQNCARAGSRLCTEELLLSADLIFVFEDRHVFEILKAVGDKVDGKLINLHIPDRFPYLDPELIDILREKVTPYLD